MPAPKSKGPAVNGDGTASKGKGGRTSASGTATPKTEVSTEAAPQPTSAGSSGRPDKTAYDAEQEKYKSEIDALQVKLSAMRDKISLATKGGGGNDRRTILRAELDSIRGQQSNNKTSRDKLIEQLKAIQDDIQTKIKNLQAAKSKTLFKTTAEIDAHIKNLDKQVESGNMKLADEKRALQEISQAKRSRRAVETFQADQEAIDARRKAADEIKKQLDDPESKAVSERFNVIKAELEEIKKEGDEAYAGRAKLFEERDKLQAEINAVYSKKRESSQTYREANDRFYTKLNEDRARRAERARAQRAEEEKAKKLEIAEQLREDASVPAFQAQIEDCQTLIDFFLGKNSAPTFASTPAVKGDVAGVAKKELRTVEAASDEGLVARKKKGENQESYFVGKGKKGKKGGAKAIPTAEANGAATPSSGSQLNVPLTTLSALLSLSIPPPASSVDVPRVVEDLNTKKAWFEANQSRVTAENLAKAEAAIQRLTVGKADTLTPQPPVDENTPPNGGAERPAEPAPTPLNDVPATAVSSEEVDEKLEGVKEEDAEASS